MKKILSFCLALGVLALVMPITTRAMTAVCSGTSSDPADVLTPFDPPSNPPEGVTIEEDVTSLNYTAATGSATYNVTCTVTDDTDFTSAPFLMAAGFNMNHDSFTVTQTSATEYSYSFSGISGDFYIPDDEDPATPDPEMVFVFMANGTDPSMTNPEPNNGPPASMGGGYISTTVQNFQIIPPSDPNDPAIGVSLTGPVGISGYFKMYLPPSMLTLMGTMSGKTMAAADMAVFIDDDQASMSVTETTSGGALIDINITFTEDDTSTAALASTDVTKEIITKEKLALSASFKKASVSKGKTAKLYGWKKSGYQNKSVNIYKKKKGATSYSLVETLKLNSTGYYKYSFKTNKKGTYYYKVKCGKISSEKQTLTIE